MPQKRQLVFMMTDTQGANCVGCYGRRELRTPNIDALAASGVRFERAYTTCPLCTPARGALFTGCYPATNGAWANEMASHGNIHHVGEYLSRAGVPAAYTGKWHLDGSDYFDRGVCPEGWDPDYWFDGRNHLESLSDEMRRFSRQYHSPQEMRDAGFTEEMTFAHGVTDRAVRFLEKHADEDFLLVVSWDEPHHPSIAPPPFCDMFQDYEFDVGPGRADDLHDKPVHQQQWAERVKSGGQGHMSAKGHYHCPQYFACNSYVDSQLGRVMDAVRRHAPEAMVVYTSDHGEMMYSHGLTSKGPAMYDEITRIPFIVSWPGVVGPAQVDCKPLSHIDVVPTILDFFAIPVPAIMPGRSLLTRLESPRSHDPRPVFMGFNRFNVHISGDMIPIRAVFDGRYKLVINLLQADELYDLQADPAELHNFIGDQKVRPVAERLHGLIAQEMQRTHDPFWASAWVQRHWTDGSYIEWAGGRSPRPSDGIDAPPLKYSTGLPWDRD